MFEEIPRVQDHVSKRWITETYRIAAYSTDPSTHVGAVIVSDDKLVGSGVNQLTREIRFRAIHVQTKSKMQEYSAT